MPIRYKEPCYTNNSKKNQAHSILQGVQNFTILGYCRAPNYPLNLILNRINILLWKSYSSYQKRKSLTSQTKIGELNIINIAIHF